MSDCTNGGRNVYDRDGYPTLRLRVEFESGETPWMYPIALNGREVTGIYVDDVRYVPEGDAIKLTAEREQKAVKR